MRMNQRIFYCRFVFLFGYTLLSIQAMKVRLIEGRGKHEGFLEISKHQSWKKVSDSKWDTRNDIVVCKQLGFADIAIKPKRLPQSNSYARFSKKHFLCQGSERKLSQCEEVSIKWDQIHLHCRRGKEVWVSCSSRKEMILTQPQISNSSAKVDYLEVRLWNKRVDGFKPATSGQLEIKIDGQWHQVCADGWTEANSHVACGQLGYSHSLDDVSNITPKQIPSYMMANVACTGAELNLLSCQHAGFKKHFNCRKPVNLSCAHSSKGNLARHVRLRGGQHASEGRVEIFMDGKWGTICHEHWDIYDANVICRQLGFGTAKKAIRWAEYGQGALPILMSNVDCDGGESDLLACKYQLPRKDCSHLKDAGVKCNFPRPQNRKVRLVGGKTRFEGRVEVHHLGQWFSICGIYFSEQDGEVVCRELGLGFLAKSFSTWEFGIRRIGIYEPRCSGNEKSILECDHRPWFEGSCRYYDMASVKCHNFAPDILINVPAMKSSIKINTWHLRDLTCSKSENCLSSTAYAKDAFINPKANTRRLMVFTSLIENRGTAAFRPNRHKNEWEWHQCHKHFHSMEYFARYDLINVHGQRIAEGHKASFCLEDSQCDGGVRKMYNCTNKGDQGISVGCADNYANAIDCQWVDVTDVPDGNYSLMVHLNPTKIIVESDYDNNVASCEIHYHLGTVDVGQCSAEPCKKRSYGGTGYGMCCHFPFKHNGTIYNDCTTEGKKALWCSTTFNFDENNKWGFCNEQGSVH